MKCFDSRALRLLLVLAVFTFTDSVQSRAQEAQDSPAVAKPSVDEEKSDEKASADDKSTDAKKLETVTAELKPIIAYESFDGVFESTRTQEIKTDFATWTDLKVESVVEQGTAVTAGQELLKFETETIDKALAEAEFEVKNSEFALATAKLEMQQINATVELDEAMAQRAWKNIKEDFEYYQQTRLPERLKDLEYSEKSAGYFLEYAKDELDQLEQMYTEDELTEESEEIVLKRQRRSVESSERNRDRSLLRVKRDRETEIPRENIQQEESFKRGELSYERSKITLPIKKQKTEIALAQAEFALENKQKSATEIQADQKKMTLASPSDGILYYGRCIRGKWSGVQSASSRQLEPGKKIPANAVVMTIVDINQLMIRANLEESQLESLTPRMRGKALIKAAGTTVPVMIKSISNIPLDDGKFDCQIMLEKLPTNDTIMPGMSCKLSFMTYQQKQAVVVAKESVFSDDDDVSHYLYLIVDGSPVRKAVTVGKTSGKVVEILEGLSEGDEIAKAKP